MATDTLRCCARPGIVSFCEERLIAYNRVGLGQMFDHGEADKLLMAEDAWYHENGITVLTETSVRGAQGSHGALPPHVSGTLGG